MLLSVKWLKEFVPYTGTAKELGDMLTMLGLELDAIIRPFENISDLVVGRVLTCEDHPDSDHLHVCTVDVGSRSEKPLDIVCGAPNVAAGQLVPVAMVGSTLPGGLVIKKAKLRGAPSEGMICSEREMALSEDHGGILVLPESNRAGASIEPGQLFVEALDLDTEVLEIGLTPNRADCLSMLGFAREVSAYCGLPLTMPAFQLEEQGADVSAELPIEIAYPEFCPSYTGRVLEGAQTAPSPLWLRYRLHAVGVRPISNLVDVTNYILMELGQPLHAFDRDKLRGGKIVVAAAKDGEKLTTLDGSERLLKAGDGLICDGEGAVALGGVMGGLATEISADSRNVFLECAVFRPASVRHTSRRLGLSSESSYRYERGVDPSGMDFARDRAATLMAELSGAKVRKGVCRCDPSPWQAAQVRFRPVKAEDLLGIPLEASFCLKTLRSLGFGVDDSNPADWQVTVPGWRYDVTREADLIEEVARFKGVDTIPATLPAISQNMQRYSSVPDPYLFLSRVKHWGAGLGLNEAVNYSFVSNKELDSLGITQAGRVNIINPLTSEQDVLRPELAPGLLQNVRLNIAHGAAGVRLFEVAKEFHADPAAETGVFEESHLGLILYGNRHDSAWPHREADIDYSDIKGIVEHFFLNCLRLPLPLLEKVEDHPYLAPAVRLTLPADASLPAQYAGASVGVMGRVKPDLADAYHARKDIWLADCNLDLLRRVCEELRTKFRPLPTYPPIRRDITIIVPDESGLKIEDLLAAVEKQGSQKGSLLEDVQVLDIYRPEKAEERNITFRLTFRHAERTLQDNEVDKEREKLVSALVDSLPVRI